jgi:transcriptional regulator NrdR family protein
VRNVTVIKVEKRDGSLQDWDKGKVLNSLAQVGLSSVETESVANLIEAWVIKNAPNDTVKSDVVRTKVIELLGIINPEASQKFAAYRKPN